MIRDERHRGGSTSGDQVISTVEDMRGRSDSIASIFAVGVAGIAVVLLWRSVEAVNQSPRSRDGCQ